MGQFYAAAIRPGVTDPNQICFDTTDNLHPNNLGQFIIASSLADVLPRLLKLQ